MLTAQGLATPSKYAAWLFPGCIRMCAVFSVMQLTRILLACQQREALLPLLCSCGQCNIMFVSLKLP